jgi:hypothetical protein
MAWRKEPDWAEVRDLVESAYRKVANQRQLKRLEATAGPGPTKPAGKRRAKR